MQQPNNMLSSDTQQSFHDMQRLQLQLQAQYRQQQQQGGQSVTNTIGSQPQAMPQQPSFPAPGIVQQHMNPTSLAALQQHQQIQQQSMGTDMSSMMQVQQQQQQQLVGLNQMTFNTSLNSTGWNPGASNGIMNQGAGSSMDASHGTSARLMAMAGMGGGGSLASPMSTGLQTAPFGSVGNGNSNNMMAMVGGAGITNGPNATSSTMQNMQVLLQQQRQQQQQSQGKSQQLKQQGNTFGSMQQQGMVLNGGNHNNLSKFQQQQQQQQSSLGGVSGNGMNMVMNGMNNTSNGNGNPNLSNMTTQQQQQFFLQQQLAAMQQQTRNNSFGGGSSGSVSANAALAALNGGGQHQQQQAVTNTPGNAAMNNLSASSAGGSTIQNQNTAVNQNLLQQRQQHLLQQMHQTQHGPQMGGNSMLQQFQPQQIQQTSGNANFRQQSDLTNKQNNIGSASSSNVGMGMMPQMPGLPQHPQLLRGSTISSTNSSGGSNIFVGNSNQDQANSTMGMLQQELQQQQTNGSNRGGGNTNMSNSTRNSPNPMMGLASLNNLTAEQHHRLQQQGLLNPNNTNSSGNANMLNNTLYGMGGNAMGNLDVDQSSSMDNLDGGGLLGDVSTSQGGFVNNNPYSDSVGVEMSSGNNTPMLSSGGGVGLSAMNVANVTLDQSSSSSVTQITNNNLASSSASVSQLQQGSFLDGRFAGGWQSNKDLPDRRKIIFNILDVIRQMRPDTSKMSNKLPHMAKSLEEHLYRSAKSKEDYMDQSTLKKRLQTIAHGLEIHREGSNVSGQRVKRSESVTSSHSNQQNSNDDGSLMAFNRAGSAIDTGTGSDNMSQQQDMTWPQAQVNNAFVSNQGLDQSGMSMNTMLGSMNSSSQAANEGNNFMRNLGIIGQQDQDNNVGGDVAIGMAHNPMNQQLQLQQNKISSTNSTWGNMGGISGSNLDVEKQQLLKQPNDIQQQMMNQLPNINNVNLSFQQQGMSEHGSTGNSVVGNMLDSSNNSTFSNHNNSSSQDNGGLSSQVSNMGGHNNQLLGMSQISGQPHGVRHSSDTWTSIGGDSGLSAGIMGGQGVNGSSATDPVAVQKKRVVLQQQQRLLLLRHASKCTFGPSCPTKFCEQMVTLWKHMKSCRNKSCKTSHCFSSRCVLNHYRICKSNGKTAKCDVCGPVMLKIKQQERDDGSVDPLVMAPDPSASSASGGSSMQHQGLMQGLAAIPSQRMRQQLQQQDLPDNNHETPLSIQSMQQGLSTEDNGEQGQIQQQQAHQQKLKAQLDSLRLIQRKQEELLRQQERLEERAQNVQDPNSTQAQQLQQQQSLLQQLQRRCQQQQILLQYRLQSQANAVNKGQMQPPQSTAEPQEQQSIEQEDESPLDSLRHLEKKQEELLRQQERLQEQAQNIHDPNSPQAQQLQQQQNLLLQIQKRCQQQQIALQLRLQPSNSGTNEVQVHSVRSNFHQQPEGQVEQSQMESVRLLQRKQEELAIQLARLDAKAQHIQDPNSEQAIQLRQQQDLLQQLQKRCQEQQMSLQQSFGELQNTEMNEGQVQSNQPISELQKEHTDVSPHEESKEPINDEPQQVKPKGVLSEGKGRRFSIGKRGKILGFKSRPEKDEDSSTKKRRASTVVTSKEKPLKRGKNLTKQSSTSQKSDNTEEAKESQSTKDEAEEDQSSIRSVTTKDEVQIHVESTNKNVELSPKTITKKCMPILQELMDDQFGWVFREAVDPVALGLPDYFDVVKRPMHLELVKTQLEDSTYSDIAVFAQDARLVFENAILYNGESSEVGELAQSMLNSFQKSYDALVQDCLENSISE